MDWEVGAMASPLQVLQKIHVRKISAINFSKFDTEEYNAPCSGRKKREVRKFRTVSVAGIELDPRPSTDLNDPLNWHRWKKEAAYGSLLATTGMICALKMLYVTTNSVIATQYNRSYVATTAFTGIPFIVAAMSSLGSTMLAQVIGKRLIFIVSGSLMLIGVLWNMHIYSSYSWFMLSRVIQAVGWGASEALVLTSVRDIFFVHERALRTNILNIVSLGFTWGSPILGGFIAQSNATFRNQLLFLAIIQAFTLFLVLVFVPETSFDRVRASLWPSISIFGETPTTGPFKTYLASLAPLKYTPRSSLQSVLQPLRAFSAPSTLLTFLLTAPILASAYGTANSLSQLFAAMPTFLFPERLGYIFILPFLFSVVAYTMTACISYAYYKPPRHLSRSSKSYDLKNLLSGLVLGVAGLLGFGMYVQNELSPKMEDAGHVISLAVTGMALSLKTVSFLFGLLVAGAGVLSFAAFKYLASSSLSTPRSPGSSNKHNYGETLLQPAHAVLENMLIGVFIMGFPSWVQGMAGLKNTVIAIAALQVVLASTVLAVLCIRGEEVKRFDRMVLAISSEKEDEEDGLQMWSKSEGSFFEA